MTADTAKQHRSCWDRKPIPDGFVETFIRFGWRGIETFYGARTSVNRRWINEAGAQQLQEQRKAYRERLRSVRSNARPA
jgi:hypothetical protein